MCLPTCVNIYHLLLTYNHKNSAQLGVVLMASAAESNKQDLSYIIDIIHKYNAAVAHENHVRFIVNNSSALLSLMGKTATVTHPKESRILMIPFALIPYRELRKKYGIYPLFIDRRLFSKEKNQRAHYLLGSDETEVGIKHCYQNANYEFFLSNPEELHKMILQKIMQMTPHNYLRNLKILFVLLVNAHFLDQDLAKKAEHYFTLLQNVRLRLRKANVNVTTYFDRYYLRIENALKNKLMPLQADERLRNEIQTQYPIIFCTSAIPSIDKDAAIFRNQLPVSLIRIALTPHEHVNTLKGKLKELGIAEHIDVHGIDRFHINELNDEPCLYRSSSSDKVNCWQELQELINKDKSLLSDKHRLLKKINNCIKDHLTGKDMEQLLVASYLFKNADAETLFAVHASLTTHIDFILQKYLYGEQRSGEHHYAVSQIISDSYLSRLEGLAYLNALVYLRKHIEGFFSLCDYAKKLSYFELQKLLEPKHMPLSLRGDYLQKYINRLQYFYLVLTHDSAMLTQYAEHISERIAFVENKYVELLEECEKDYGLSEEVLYSNLYQATKKSLLETKKKWLSLILSKIPNKHKKIAAEKFKHK